MPSVRIKILLSAAGSESGARFDGEHRRAVDELTFKEAEISKLYTKVHPATARCWRNVRRWKTKKPNLMVRNGDAENPAGDCAPDPRCRAGQQVYMQLLNKEQELKITEPAPSAMCALLTRQSPSLAC